MQESKPTAEQVRQAFDTALSQNFGERTVFRALIGEESVVVVECYRTETIESSLERRGKKEQTGDLPRYTAHVVARVAPIDATLTDHTVWSSVGEARHFDDPEGGEWFAEQIDHAQSVGRLFLDDDGEGGDGDA